MTTLSDKELLEKFYADGNNHWLGLLLERYTMLLLGVCMKYLKNEEEAKDTVQQIFLKVIAELGKYKVTYFKSWLYMIAKNECLMKLRSSPLKRTAELDETMTAVVPADIFLHDKEITLTLIENSLNELGQEQQVCITLFYLQQQSYQQVSDATGFNMLQVKSFIQNGKRNLKLIVERKLKQVNG